MYPCSPYSASWAMRASFLARSLATFRAFSLSRSLAPSPRSSATAG